MYGHGFYGDGGSILMMFVAGFFVLLVFAGLFIALWLAVMGTRGNRMHGPMGPGMMGHRMMGPGMMDNDMSGGRDEAMEILRERYAKGKITKEEFEQIKADLQA